MITVTCTEKLRDKNNRIVGYELRDCNGTKMRFTSEQVKQAVFLQQITITNLKLTSDGRLIDNTELAKSDGQLKSNENNQLTLINKLKNMKCYQIMQLSVDDIAHIIEKMSNIKLERIPFIDYENCGDIGKLYFSGCTPFFIIGTDPKKMTKCEHCNRTEEDVDNKGCSIEIALPSNDEKYSSYIWGGDFHCFVIPANDIKALVQIASLFKDIPSTKISYGDMAYALYELMLKYVDTKYATVNNVLKLYSEALSDKDDDFIKVKTDITTLNFVIQYKEGGIYVRNTHIKDINTTVVNVFMQLTKEGYKIQVLDYEYKIDYSSTGLIVERENNCSSITIGFNDDINNAMRKVKLLIDAKFKSSLKDVKDLAKEIKKSLNTNKLFK